MSTTTGIILIVILTVCFVVCGLAAICAIRLSSKISQQEDADEYGAPEAAYPTPEQTLLRQ